MISVKILSADCSKCRKLEAVVRRLVESKNITATIEKITDVQKMLQYGYVLLPALIINEKVKCHGYVPKEEQIITWLKEN
ncbi:MAG: thioredoxin family protein [Ignavibacteriales bacterium]|nr:thioredoxin family protein [Ignavibacteriales bacterium]